MTVATVERGFFEVVFCSMEMAGDRPSIRSTSGLDISLKELTRIGRQGFDIAPLSFGIDGVEGKRRLARSGQAGDHHQLIAGDIDVDILEIVFAGATHPDDTLMHASYGAEDRMCNRTALPGGNAVPGGQNHLGAQGAPV